MKTTGIFLFIATFVALFYSTSATLDLTGYWFVTKAVNLRGQYQHPKSWTLAMKAAGSYINGTSTFFDEEKSETVESNFKLVRYKYDDIDMYNVVSLNQPREFKSFNIRAIDNEDGTIVLYEIRDAQTPETEPVAGLRITRDDALIEDSSIWDSCEAPYEVQII